MCVKHVEFQRLLRHGFLALQVVAYCLMLSPNMVPQISEKVFVSAGFFERSHKEIVLRLLE